jgi:hypothetical protein
MSKDRKIEELVPDALKRELSACTDHDMIEYITGRVMTVNDPS